MPQLPEPTQQQVEDYAKALGKRLKDLRDERGLKRKWVAKQLGVHYDTVKYWELGKTRPGPKGILFLAKVYGVEPEEFYEGIDIRP